MKSEIDKREEINFKQIYGRDPFKETDELLDAIIADEENIMKKEIKIDDITLTSFHPEPEDLIILSMPPYEYDVETTRNMCIQLHDLFPKNEVMVKFDDILILSSKKE